MRRRAPWVDIVLWMAFLSSGGLAFVLLRQDRPLTAMIPATIMFLLPVGDSEWRTRAQFHEGDPNAPWRRQARARAIGRLALLLAGILMLPFAFPAYRELFPVLPMYALFAVGVMIGARPIILNAEKNWITRQGRHDNTRIAHLNQTPRFHFWEGVAAPYFAASSALFIGAATANILRWLGNETDYYVLAVSTTLLATSLTSAACVAIWARSWAGLRRVNIHTVENRPATDFPPLNLVTSTGFILSTIGIVAAQIPYPLTRSAAENALELTTLAVFGAFAIPLATAIVYWLLYIENDAQRLRELTRSRGVRSYRDL